MTDSLPLVPASGTEDAGHAEEGKQQEYMIFTLLFSDLLQALEDRSGVYSAGYETVPASLCQKKLHQ